MNTQTWLTLLCLLAPPGLGCSSNLGQPKGESEGAESQSSDNDDQEDPGDAGPGNNQNSPSPDDCISDRVQPPSDGNCQCEFTDCEATTLSCTCDVGCHADPDCLISTDAEGNAETADGFLGECNLSCVPENDLSTDLSCSASDCNPNPNVEVLDPVAPPAPPAELTLLREVVSVEALFVIDNSGSMFNDQMAAACAVDSFFATANQNGAQNQVGVLSTDLKGDILDNAGTPCTNPGTTYSESGEFIEAPGLTGLDGACFEEPVCACGTTDEPVGQACDLNNSGDWVPGSDPGAPIALKQRLVQGDGCSYDEGGLEQAFQFYADQERKGIFDPTIPRELIVISDEDGDADNWLCPFDSVDRNTTGIPNFSPPTPTNSVASCKTDLANFYAYYFSSRNIIVNGILFTPDCNRESTEEVGNVYLPVIAATGGRSTSICQCDSFDGFFEEIGNDTATLSTSLCLGDQSVDPATLDLIYTEGGLTQTVPQNPTNGWSYDAGLNCLVLGGSWQDQYGEFLLRYIDPTLPPPPLESLACLDASPAPLPDTIAVYCDADTVPASGTEGWTYDSTTKCLTLRGSFAEATCVFSVEYF